MNIQFLSDLHLDNHRDAGKGFIEALDPTGVDVLVIAGDLAETKHVGYSRMLRTICKKYPQVVYTPGNHEFWHSTREAAQIVLDECSARFPNLHILQDRVVTIGGQRFVGSTLWFQDGPTARMRAKRWIDFRRIEGFDTWIWSASQKAHEYLVDTVRPSDVVVTHYLPLHKSLDERFCGKEGKPSDNCFYLHNLPEIFDRGGPSIWIHGHTHIVRDYEAGNTRVLCNPLGYAMEGTGYDQDRRVDQIS